MTSHAPGQAVFGRDMLSELLMKVDWQLQQDRQDEQANQTNHRENEGRIDHDFSPDYIVITAKRDLQAHTFQSLFDDPSAS
ncbi:hypothetical protein JG687_00005808 [Phytophthora cactorum]|uniref:Uncharacterized protein n=2 Tax=Phytophthora TaxID=4783 RepID=A0A8J5M8D6_9STRA|nr:hypothetical protein JG687_00005808 [Phytophthora cactorum]KAG6968591.1 hypothetical protein JG688_00005723 [Phytophthora aleatoria]